MYSLGANHPKREMETPERFTIKNQCGCKDLYRMRHIESNETQSISSFVFTIDTSRFPHFAFHVTSFVIHALQMSLRVLLAPSDVNIIGL